MVSDFCTEITAIGDALVSGGELPNPVHTFVEQCFAPKPRTPEQYKGSKRPNYPSRRELIKSETRMAQRAGLDGDRQRILHEFINSGSDAYVHGTYETTMELYDPHIGRFRMRGVRDPS